MNTSLENDNNRSKKVNRMIFILAFMAFWANGDNYAVAPLIIKISEDLQITITQAALSATAYMLTFGFFTIFFGPISDRFGKAKVINIAAFGTALFSIIGAFSVNLPYLIIARAFNGAFAAGIFPVTMALVGETVEPSKRQVTIGKVMGMMFLGGASATAIGGVISYFGSWRQVYLIYGIAELILALVMLKVVTNTPINKETKFLEAYKNVMKNKQLLKIIMIIFIMGFTVFGSFTYLGEYIKNVTKFNILVVGLILSAFGIGTVIGGRNASLIKGKLKNKFLLFAGLIASISLILIALVENYYIIGFGLFGFGLGFVLLQSTLVMSAQETVPQYRGTAMSLASFNMFVGGGIGTLINGTIINHYQANIIYIIASFMILLVGLLATIVLKK